MKRGMLERFGERGLRVGLAVFFLALAVPLGVLIAQAYGQLKWSAFRSTQIAAEELALRIDSPVFSVKGEKNAPGSAEAPGTTQKEGTQRYLPIVGASFSLRF